MALLASAAVTIPASVVMRFACILSVERSISKSFEGLS
jgi:hypothetical protein